MPPALRSSDTIVEVVNALCGCAQWAIDLLCWITDSLFGLRGDPKFMDLLQDTRSFTEMTNFLKAKNDISVHLLLCSSTRGFLAAICRRLTHLQSIATKAVQYWENRPPMQSTDSHASTSRSLHQAYLRLHKCTTTDLVKVDEFDRLLSSVGADVRQAYQTSLAGLHQRHQQQQQGQPSRPGQSNSAEQAVKKAQAHCELMILLGDQPPSNSFQPLVKKLFETDLRNLMGSSDRAELFFTDFPLLEVEENPQRLAARQAEGLYVDVFRRVELRDPKLGKDAANGAEFVVPGTGSPGYRRCVRCCSVMEDVVASRPGYNFVVAQQRKCACGGNWAALP